MTKAYINVSFKKSEKELADKFFAECKKRKIKPLHLVKEILRNHYFPQTLTKPSSEILQTSEKATFGVTDIDYDSWVPDCEFGTYIKDKRKVRCRWSPSYEKLKEVVFAWQPRNRLIEPQVCDDCFACQQFGYMGSFLAWRLKRQTDNPKEKRESKEEKEPVKRISDEEWKKRHKAHTW